MHSEAGAFIDELYLQARAVNTVIDMYYVCNYRIIYNCNKVPGKQVVIVM